MKVSTRDSYDFTRRAAPAAVVAAA